MGARPSFPCAAVAYALGTLAACAHGFRITGQNAEDPTWSRGQSETSVAAGYGPYAGHIVVAYNDLTGTEETILFPPGSRKVLSGASLMGWSYSADGGRTWRYGGKVAPNELFPVLWGDPAVASSIYDPRYVFLSNLATAASKFPAEGITGSLVNADGSSPIGGACLARSSDGGTTFPPLQCLFTGDLDFYDGGHMATNLRGETFVGYVNITKARVDAWRSPAIDGAFALLPDPFPGHAVTIHPRLRAELFSGDLYVLALDSSGTLLLNRWTNGAWQQPQVAATGAAGYPNIAFSNRSLRTGPQFSFDVGAASMPDGRDAVRVLYAAPDGGRLRVKGSMCFADLRACFDAPGFQVDLPGDQFSPNVRAFTFPWVEPAWKATFVSRDASPAGGVVTVRAGDLVVQPDGKHGFPTRQVLDVMVPCPDNRGYWGDYHDLQWTGVEGGAMRFLYTFTDSSAGTCVRDQFTSSPVHVMGVRP